MGVRELIIILAVVATPLYAQWNVGVSGTRKGNSAGNRCFFPFIYQQVSYSECITLDNRDTPWCATTANYDANGQWANCEVTIIANRTRRGNAGKSTCYFPFTYKGRSYETCTTVDYFSNKPWCATSPFYQRDKQWAECVRYSDVKTTGGNVPAGTQCNFPFWYRGVNYHGCTTVNNNGVGWCAISPDYEDDKLWGNCDPNTIGSSGPADPNCPNGNTYVQERNTLSYGGIGIVGITTIQDCQFVCDRDSLCLGFDWDYFAGISLRCYIHNNTVNFANKERQNIFEVDQYTLTNRCTTNPSNNNPNTGIVTVRGGNSGRSTQCSFPFVYRGKTYTWCTSQNWYTPWCAVTSNYDRDLRWGECDNIPTM